MSCILSDCVVSFPSPSQLRAAAFPQLPGISCQSIYLYLMSSLWLRGTQLLPNIVLMYVLLDSSGSLMRQQSLASFLVHEISPYIIMACYFDNILRNIWANNTRFSTTEHKLMDVAF